MANLVRQMVLAFLASTCYASTQQSITVNGKLVCGKDVLTSKNCWVKLLNKRIGFDDQVEVPCSDNGTFTVTLTVSRKMDMIPAVHLYTDCNDDALGIPKPCQRKIEIKIPSKYVNSNTPYDIGTYQLESKFDDESRDCSLKRTGSGLPINPLDHKYGLDGLYGPL